MKTQKQQIRFLMASLLALVTFMACNKDDGGDPIPQPAIDEAIGIADLQIQDAGLARVENLDPRNPSGSAAPTHVNYAVSLVNTDLVEVQFGESTFFQIDENDPSNVLIAVAFNIYSPIVTFGGGATANVLGGANERTFRLETFENRTQIGAEEYFFSGAALAILDRNDAANIRAYMVTEGTVTVSGSLPNLTFTFDLTFFDDVRNLTSTLTGSVTPSFRVIEND